MGQKVLRPWTLKAVLGDAAGTAVYVRIAQAIVRDIQRGRLKPGAILPSSRELAESLQVNRKTVMLAFDELVSQGWITSEGRRGTFVSVELPLSFHTARKTIGLSERPSRDAPDPNLRTRTTSLALDVVEDGATAFSDGVPDTRLAPLASLARIQNAAMRSLGHRNGLAYGGQSGSPELRAGLADMLRSERGLNAVPDEICVTRGSQMAIYLAAQVLCRPGDTVVLEELSYPPAWETFRHAGADVVAAPMDDDGLDPVFLEQVCRSRRVVAIYLTPHHHYPTTRLMRMPRRMRLLQLAELHGFAIIEDDYDHEFHFHRNPVLPMAASEHAGQVVYVGSLSKLLAPGLRCGYLVGSRAFVREVQKLVLLIDRCGNPVVEGMLAEALRSSILKRHAARALRIYEARLEHVAERLGEDFNPYFSFALPAGGLALWVKLTGELDIDRLVASANEHDLVLTAGSYYSLVSSKIHALRLGYAARTETEIDVLLDRLLRACRHAQHA